MPAMSKNDPRYYVKQIPLPVPSQKGVKIQARSDQVYNPVEPTRNDIRKENYSRRYKQMREQGFNAANYKPYQGIGDPFYLDKKKLILNALGQWNPADDQDSSSSVDSDDAEEKKTQQHPQQKAFTTTNFFVRRTRKDLNTLNKETTHGREMIRNVRLGHGLFYMLRRMRQQKVMSEQRELKKRQEQQRNEWQPPKYESSSDELESEDESDLELELKQYLSDDQCEKDTMVTEKVPVSPEMTISVACDNTVETPQPMESVKASRVAFQGVECISTSDRPRSLRSGKTSSRPGSRRKVLPPRPFTPNHSNINTDMDYNLDKEALFRQLCALYWLLEAMNVENANTMAPISTCWSRREIGGSKGKDRKHEKERLDTHWNKFVTKQNALKLPTLHDDHFYRPWRLFHTRTPSPAQSQEEVDENQAPTTLMTVAGGKRSSRMSKSYHRYGGYKPQAHRHRGSSITSMARSETPPGSTTHLNESMQGQATAPPNIKVDSVIPESSHGDSGHTDPDDDEDNIYTRGLFRFLDEYYDSLRKKESGEANEDKHSTAEVASSHSARSEKRGKERYAESDYGRRPRLTSTALSPQQYQEQQEVPEYEDLSPQEITAILETIERSYLDPRLHKLANPTERRTAKNMRADINVRPKSSPAVLDFKCNLPSVKRGCLPTSMRQQFIEVNQNKALILHDTLEALDRERLRKVQNKFMHLPTEGSSFWKAVRTMRSRSVMEEEHLRESQRKQSLYQQWFTDLDSNIPHHLKQDWHFGKILQKLQKYGLVEANKQSAYKFLMVLSSLRDWEVCSPDICSAIEYCRERIVEMPIDEYEEWFRQQFPKVIRPQTAPAAVKSTENGSRERITQRHNGNGLVPHSAPPGGRKMVS